MASNIKFNIGFEVDKESLNKITQPLKKIQEEAKKASLTGNLTKELEESSNAAKKLETILNSAWNTKLNQLNLSKVNTEIKNSYGNIAKLKTALVQSGEAGRKAYESFATEILNTNLQIKKSSVLLDSMAQSMKNTIKWGITSSIFNTFTGEIQKAWNYTKRLDESLNNIRIVTGKSAEEMQKYAKAANAAAKQLGATTTAYTDASLIYYQQGLSDEEAKARTETTVKMSNVLGESAEEVSNYMTAIWNNFAKGSKDIEVFADKITALGASTASSSEEIAQGLEKFASVAETSGLSYDYATSALATVVAATRQSADTVGTAFKTLFARIQGLNLGETLDDGTTLNKYSQALAAVGISIKGQNGELKAMDDILDEMGAKWKDLSKDQQVALAETIAGTRQYNQLMSLMENWDFMQENLQTVANATGQLNEQQGIYLDSIEAHMKSLRAETERTYDILFDADTVNSFADVLTDLLTGFNDFIEGIGGGRNAIIYFGNMVATVFNKQISQGILNAKNNFVGFINNLKAANAKEQIVAAEVKQQNSESAETAGIQESSRAFETQVKANERILKVKKGLTQESQKELIKIQQQLGVNIAQQEALEKQKVEKERLIKKDEELKVLENFSLKTAKNKLKIQEKEFQEISDYYEDVIRATNILKAAEQKREKAKNSNNTSIDYEDRLRIQNLLNEAKNQGLQIDNSVVQLLNQENMTSQQALNLQNALNLILDDSQKKYKSQEELVKHLIEYTNIRKNLESGELEALQQEENSLKNQFNSKIKGAESLAKTQKVTTAATSAISGLTAVIGSAGTLLDKTSTKVEKTEAVASAATGVASAAAMGIGTALGGPLVGSALSTLTGGIASAIGEGFTKAAKEEEEALQKMEERAKEALQNTYDKIDELENKQSSLEGREVDWEKYSKSVDEYGNNISLTADEYADYLSLCEEMALLSDDLIEGYNKESKAIITKRDAIQEVINKLKEQEIEEKKKLTYGTDAATAAEEEKKAVEEAKQKKDDTYDARYEKIKEYYEEHSNEFTYDYTQKGVSTTNKSGEEAFLELKALFNEENLDKHKQSIDNYLIKKYLNTTDKEEQKRLNSFMAAIESDRKIDTSEFVMYGDLLAEVANNVIAPRTGATFEGIDNLFKGELQEGALDIINSYGKTLEDDTKEIEDALAGAQERIHSAVFLADESTKAAIEEMTSEQVSFVEAYIKTLKYDPDDEDYEGQFNEMVKKAKEFTKNIAKLDKDAVAELYKIKDPSNYASAEDYENAVNSIMENLQKAVDNNEISEDDKISILDFLGFKANDKGTLESQLEQAKNYIAERYGEDFDKIGLEITSPEDIINFSKYLETFTGEVNKNAEGIFLNNKAQQEFKRTIEELTGTIDTASDAIDTLMKGDELSEDQIAALKNLEYEYEELAAIQDRTSIAYLNKLIEIREALEKQKTLQLQQNQNEKIEKVTEKLKIDVNAELNETELVNDLEEICNQEYEILVSVKSDIQDDFDTTVSAIDKIEEAASKIGEDFVVSAEDIEELNDVFPGILANMEILEDGNAKLNENIVKGAIETAKAEIEADQNKTIEALYNQATELAAKRDAAKTVANIAKDIANGAKKTTEVQEELDTALNTLKTDNSEETSKVEQTNNNNVAENAVTTANQMANAYGEAYAQMGQDACVWGEKAHQALLASKDVKVEPPTVTPGEFGGASFKTTVEVTSSVKVEEGKIKDIGNYSGDNIDWQKVSDYYETLAQSYDEAYNNAVGKLEETEARGQKALYALTNIGNGLGKDGKKDSDSKDAIEDKKDIYHDIDIEIKNIERDLNRLQKAESRVFGRELIENLSKQLDLLNKQNDAYARKIKIAESEANRLQSSLSSQGVQFSEDGTIANYFEIIEAKRQYLNNLTEKYNSMTKDEQEAHKDTYDQAKKSYDNFMSDISNYDKVITETLPDLQDKIEDTLSKEIEIQVKKFDVEFDVKLDLTKATKEWNNFKKKVIDGIKDDDLLGNSNEVFSNLGLYYNKQGGGQIQTDTKKVSSIMAEIDKINKGGHSDIYSAYDKATGKWINNINKAYEDLNTASSQLKSNLLEYQGMVEQATQNFLKGIDNVAEAYSLQSKSLQFFRKQIDHDVKMIQLLYGNKSYSKLAKQYEKQIKNDEIQVQNLKKQTSYWKEMMDAARQAGDTEAYKKYRDNWLSSIEELNSTIEKWSEDVTTQYTNTINKIFDELNRKLSDGKSLEYIGDELELINKNSDLFLDSVESAYSIQSLRYKIQSSMESKSISAQKKINSLTDDLLKKLEAKEKISQADIDRAEKEYDLVMKRIALEEALQNKNKVQLKRNASGNYSYQFVTDEDNISQAEQDLADAQNELYKFDKDKYNENLNQIHSVMQEFQEKVAALEADTDLTEKERTEKRKLLESQYQEYVSGLIEQNTTFRENLHSSAFDSLKEAYKELSDTEYQIMFDKMVPSWNSGVQKMIDKINGSGGLSEVYKDAFDKIHQAGKDYHDTLAKIGKTSDAVAKQVKNEEKALTAESNNAVTAAQKELTALQAIKEEIEAITQGYKDMYTAAVDAVSQAWEYYKVWKTIEDEKAKKEEKKNSKNTVGNKTNSSGDSDIFKGSRGGDAEDDPEVAKTGHFIYTDLENWKKQTYDDKVHREHVKDFYKDYIANAEQGTSREKLMEEAMKKNYSYSEFLIAMNIKGKGGNANAALNLMGFDSGGYTGEWGSNGKLAVLHEKELILNKTDTQNLLDTIEMIREISISELAKQIDNYNKILSNLNISPSGDTVNEFHINAEFPNANDAIEIQEAILNLPNLANQYLAKKYM